MSMKNKTTFFGRTRRHVRGHRTKNGVHPSLIVGNRSKSLFYMGMDTTKPRKRFMELKQPAIDKKTGKKIPKYLKLQIESDQKGRFSKEIYPGHKFTKEENAIIDEQIKKKRKFLKKKPRANHE